MNENKEEYLTEEDQKELDQLMTGEQEEYEPEYSVYVYQDGNFEELVLTTKDPKEAEMTAMYVYSCVGPFIADKKVKPGMVYVEVVEGSNADRLWRKAIEIVE